MQAPMQLSSIVWMNLLRGRIAKLRTEMMAGR